MTIAVSAPRVALATLLMFLGASPAVAQEGCWHAGFINALQETSGVTIKVFVHSSYLSEKLGGDPGFSSAVRLQLLQQVLGKVHAELGSVIAFEYVGPEEGDVPTCEETPPGSPEEPDFPYLTIMNDSTNAAAHAWTKARLNGDSPQTFRCARTRLVPDRVGDASYTVDRLQSLLTHELGHAIGLRHRGDFCSSKPPFAYGCWSRGNGCCRDIDGAACPSIEDKRWIPYLERSDKWTIRQDIQTTQGIALEKWSTFSPLTWNSGSSWYDGYVISAVAAADAPDDQRGYVWNIETTTGGYEVRARLNQGGTWTNYVPSTTPSYYPPDITRSRGQTTDKWMVAFLVGDSLSSAARYVRIAEKAVGSGSWTESSIGSTDLPHVALTYDPASERFVVIVEQYDTSTEVEGLRFYSRTPSGTSWTYVHTTIQTFDGADIACSAHGGPSDRNCLLTYVNRDDARSIRWRRFRVQSNGALDFESTDHSLYLLGFSRPTLAVNPLDADPQFTLGFSQAITAPSTIYTRKLNRNASAWSGTTATAAPAFPWLGPAGFGGWSSGGTPRVDAAMGY